MGTKLRQLEAFRNVMREGSMVRASTAMSISQPGISYLISGLEKEVGFPLFLRSKTRITPTPEALQLASEVDRLYEGLDAIDAAAKQIANHRSALLRILVTPALASNSVIGAIGAFAAKHPGLRLDIDVANRATVIRKVGTGQSDAGLVSLPTTSDQVVETKLLSRGLVCVIPSSSGLRDLRSVKPVDLENARLIGVKSGGLVRPLVDRWLTSGGTSARFEIEVRDGRTALELVRSGAGVAIMSAFTADGRANDDVVVLPLDCVENIEIGIVRPKEQRNGRTVTALSDFLRTQQFE